MKSGSAAGAGAQQVLRQLTEQWSVLETLTPSEYMGFRDVLGPSSGFQSLQYRYIEFLLGNKNAQMLQVFEHDPAGQAQLRIVLEAPSLYEEFLKYLARFGHAVPAVYEAHDWTQPHVADDALQPVFERIYQDTDRYWREYALCEDLVDLETAFQLWRFRHAHGDARDRLQARHRRLVRRGLPRQGAGADLLPRTVPGAHQPAGGTPAELG